MDKIKQWGGVQNTQMVGKAAISILNCYNKREREYPTLWQDFNWQPSGKDIAKGGNEHYLSLKKAIIRTQRNSEKNYSWK